MKLLFMCNAGLNRCPTGADVAIQLGHEARHAGIQSSDEELQPLLEWADAVFVMEKWMRKELSERFPGEYLKKRIMVLDVKDIYRKDQPELVNILAKKIKLNIPET